MLRRKLQAFVLIRASSGKQKLQAASALKLQAASNKRQATSINNIIDMWDTIGYKLFRTAAGDPAVFGNGNGPLWDQLNASPPRSWRQLHRKNVQRGCDLELPGLWPPATSSIKQQASSSKPLEVIDASIKPRATSVKRQAASGKLLDSLTSVQIYLVLLKKF